MKLASNKQYTIVFSSVGYENDTLIIPAKLQNTATEVNLKPVDFQLEEMQESNRNESRGISQISLATLMPNEIKAIPILFGEKDPIKAFQLLSGIQQASEGSSMFLVRGGGR